MSKWVQFGRKFNFIPNKAPAAAIQYPAGAVESVTEECAKRAIANGAGIEVEAPANAAEAEAMRAGQVEPRPVKVKADKAEKLDTAPPSPPTPPTAPAKAS